MELTDEHLAQLRIARRHLVEVPLGMKLAEQIGKTFHAVSKQLPDQTLKRIYGIVGKSLEHGSRWAVATVRGKQWVSDQRRRHKVIVGASGAIGGALGVAGFAAEFPFTTLAMLRSIAAIARSHGEHLEDPQVALECVSVLAYGSGENGAKPAENRYYATRVAVTPAISQAVQFLGGHATARVPANASPALLRILSPVVTRFGEAAVQKFLVQSVPVLGGVAGAGINLAFIDYFQNVAHGHFTVRRLERTYGAERVRSAFGSLDGPGASRLEAL